MAASRTAACRRLARTPQQRAHRGRLPPQVAGGNFWGKAQRADGFPDASPHLLVLGMETRETVVTLLVRGLVEPVMDQVHVPHELPAMVHAFGRGQEVTQEAEL